MKVQIISPSKCIEPNLIDDAKKFLESKEMEVVVSNFAKNSDNYFSGTFEQRKNDFQEAIDSDADVIWTSRGGYGLIQYIDQLNFDSFQSSPKLLVGFSDVTVAHLRLNQLGFKSIHGTVPLNFKNVTAESLQSIFNVFNGKGNTYIINPSEYNILGRTEAEVIGGNLAIIYSMLGTSYLPDFKSKLLFIEDIGEALYAIDRMMNALRLNGVLDQISGLIVGGFTSVGDSIPKYGECLEEIISKYLKHREIPVCFNFPAGHQEDNRAIVLGANAEFVVKENEVVFKQI